MKNLTLSRLLYASLGAIVAGVLFIGCLTQGVDMVSFNEHGVFWYPGQEPSKLSEPFNQPTPPKATSQEGTTP